MSMMFLTSCFSDAYTILKYKKIEVNILEGYVLEGGKKLDGEVVISGSKNAALPIIAATILNDKKVEITNCPDIHDVKIMLTILKALGCSVHMNENRVLIDTSNINNCEIPENLMHEMRSSVIIVGAMLGRMKKCVFTYPGGCEIGSRPMHLDGFKQLGVDIVEDQGKITCKCKTLKGADITLDFPSVGATENIMLAGVFADGMTVIRNVAREPEIKDLQDFLNGMGANVTGAGSNTIVIRGIKKLHEVSHKVIPDRIEAGTYLCISAVTHSNIILRNVIPEHVASTVHKLRQVGCRLDFRKNEITSYSPKIILPANIKTMPYPGFPTDMQSQFAALLSIANGTSIIIETIFENRFKYVNELIRMGANITVEGRSAIIQGVKELHGATVEMKDLRGGAALVIASLAANGTSIITGISFLERGYENFVNKLQLIGAKLKISDIL